MNGLVKSVRAMMCLAGLLMGTSQAALLSPPVSGQRAFRIPHAMSVAASVNRAYGHKQTRMPEYSVFSQSEAVVRHLHDALEKTLTRAQYELEGPAVEGGQGITRWYNPAENQSVVSVQWSTEEGYAQLTFRQSGHWNDGQASDIGPLAKAVADQTLEEELHSFAFTPPADDAPQMIPAEKRYQQLHNGLVNRLQERGFRPLWKRDLDDDQGLISYAAWFHPDLNLTVLCTSWPVQESHGQTVSILPGKTNAKEFTPMF